MLYLYDVMGGGGSLTTLYAVTMHHYLRHRQKAASRRQWLFSFLPFARTREIHPEAGQTLRVQLFPCMRCQFPAIQAAVYVFFDRRLFGVQMEGAAVYC